MEGTQINKKLHKYIPKIYSNNIRNDRPAQLESSISILPDGMKGKTASLWGVYTGLGAMNNHVQCKFIGFGAMHDQFDYGFIVVGPWMATFL